MRLFVCLVALAAAGAVASASGQALPSATGLSACATGSVTALIGGHVACLRAGARCQARFAAQYARHGFTCVGGKLRRRTHGPAPKPPSYPKLPPPPAGPDTTTLPMPVASPLPPAASTLAFSAPTWAPSVSDISPTADALWVSSGIFRIDPATNAVTGPMTALPSADMTAGAGSIWASDYDGNAVRRFDTATGKLVALVHLPLPLGSSPEGLVDAGGAIWVATHHGGALMRIDPQTNKVSVAVVLTMPGPSGPQGVAAGLGSVWVDVPNVNSVFRVDPATNSISAIIRLPSQMSPCGGIAVGETAVWVTNCLDGTLVARIDPATNKVVSVLDVGGLVVQPAADGNSVWFVAGGDPDQSPVPGYLIHLRADDTVVSRTAVSNGFISGGTAVAFGSIWISDFAHPRVVRIPRTATN